jgi:hypothetical protein
MPARRSVHRPRPVAVAALLALAAPLAIAQTNPWYVGISQTFVHDSNLYRVEGDLPPGYSRSDTISVTSLVGGLDQPIGRQRLFGTVKLDNNRYQNNEYLNDHGYSVTGGVDWATAENVSGTLSLAGSEQQRKFNVDTAPGVVDTQKNLERVNQADLVARIGVVTPLTFEGQLGFRRLDYTAPEYSSSEYEQSRGSLGVRWRPGITTFGVAASLADTNYDSTAERVKRSALDFTAYWPGSGASTVWMRLSPTRVEYDELSERDFDGLTGALKWTWVPTGKLNIDTRLVHDIGQDSSFETFGGPVGPAASTTGRTSTELRITVGYAATAKILVDASLSGQHRELESTAVSGGQVIVTGSGKDGTLVASLGARWEPIRSVLLGCQYSYGKRSAEGGLSQDYSGSVFNCFGQFTLQ